MKFSIKSGRDLLRRNIPLPYFFVAIMVTATLTYLKIIGSSNAEYSERKTKNIIELQSRTVHQIRSKDYVFARPLILSDHDEDAPELYDLKVSIEQYIADKTLSGEIKDASIYIRKLNEGKIIRINIGQRYNPGSTAKISILLTYLKISEKKPSILNEVYSSLPGEYHPINQYFHSEEIVPGKNYTVKDLLYFMIVKSSNSATELLSKHLDNTAFKRLYSDLGISDDVSLSDGGFTMNADDISKFMRVLYNASYLNADNSDFALFLLSKAEFYDGILSSIPKSIKAVHKFGEQGDQEYRQLHETAIIYLNDSPYLLTILSRGKDMKDLTNFVSGVSKIVYNRFNMNI